MEKPRIFLDTDVLINWISKEVDKNSGFKLWKSPYEIIKNFLIDLFNNIQIEIPDTFDMLYANKLQEENPLDPFDAIGLSIVKAIDSCILVSRDSDFIKLTENSNLNAFVPEKFLQIYFPELFEDVKSDLL